MKIVLYEKIYRDLYRKIKSQHYEAGDMLPTEQEMEKIYKTSKAPIRQALGKLEYEGLIVRRAGKGTFVTQKEASGPWLTLGGFGQELSNKWDDLQAKTIGIETITADSVIANHLSLEYGTQITTTKRIRILRGVPIYYLQHYTHRLPVGLIEDAGDFKSMRAVFTQAGINIRSAGEEVVAAGAQGNVCDTLGIAPGTPVLHIVRISYDEEYQPVEFLDYYVLTDDWHYRVLYDLLPPGKNK